MSIPSALLHLIPVKHGASDIINDSSVSGSSVKDALNTLSGASSPSWSTVLGVGNTSGAHDAIIIDNQSLYSGTGSDGRIKYTGTNWLFDLLTTGDMYITNSDTIFSNTAKLKFATSTVLTADPASTTIGNVFNYSLNDGGYGMNWTSRGTVFNTSFTLNDRVNSGFAVSQYNGFFNNVTFTGNENPSSTAFYIPLLQGTGATVNLTGTFGGSFNTSINPFIYTFNSDANMNPSGLAIVVNDYGGTIGGSSTYGNITMFLAELACTTSGAISSLVGFDFNPFQNCTVSNEIIGYRAALNGVRPDLVNGAAGPVIGFKASTGRADTNMRAFYAEMGDPSQVAFMSVEGYWDNHTYNPFYFGTVSESSIMYNGTNFVISPKLSGSGYLDIVGSVNTPGTTGNTYRWNASTTAPSTTATPVFTSYYGGNTKALGDPVGWIIINVAGTDRKVAFY